IAAAACLCAGDSGTARGELGRLEALGPRLRRGDRACVHYLRGWLAAFEGELVEAHREAKITLALATETGIPSLECIARIALAELQIGRADARGVETQLRAAEVLVQRMRCPWLNFGVQLAAAEDRLEAGEQRVALDGIRAAFRLGHEHGFRRGPGWRPRALGKLCALALESDAESEFARTLVREGRLTPESPPLRAKRWPWAFRIKTFGDFRCLRDDAPVELSGKGPGRPMELLKVLIALGGENVRADQVADALWPHMEADYAYKSFTATLHRLRRTLEEDDTLIL